MTSRSPSAEISLLLFCSLESRPVIFRRIHEVPKHDILYWLPVVSKRPRLFGSPGRRQPCDLRHLNPLQPVRGNTCFTQLDINPYIPSSAGPVILIIVIHCYRQGPYGPQGPTSLFIAMLQARPHHLDGTEATSSLCRLVDDLIGWACLSSRWMIYHLVSGSQTGVYYGEVRQCQHTL